MGKSKNSEPIVLGYNYYMGAQMVLCQAADKLVKIVVDDTRLLWSGTATDTTITVNKPDIFGGQSGNKREGGIKGPVKICMGKPDQVADSYLASKLGTGANTPAYRGVVTAILKHVLIGYNNYYLKPWHFELVRIHYRDRYVTQWYDAKAEIGTDQMNPAHILRECYTSTVWGMGYLETDMGLTWTTVADTLYTEGMGLSFLWNRESDISDFIDNVLEHIDAAIYQDRSTGKIEIKLVRDDYTVGTLLLLSTSNVKSVSGFKRSVLGDLVNSVTVKFWNQATGKDGAAEARDDALLALQKRIIHRDINLDGVTNQALAQKLATQKLRQLSTPLYVCQIECNRDAEVLYPGYAFRLYWPDYLDAELVMRVTDLDYGELTNNTIKINCVQDIFSTAQTTYTIPPETGWTDPINAPADVTNYLLLDVPYYLLARVLGDSTAQGYDGTQAFLTTAAERPSADSYGANIWTDVGTGYIYNGFMSFCPTAITSMALVQQTSTTITLASYNGLDRVEIGTFCQIDNELMAVTAVASDFTTVTVNRGVLDTVPTTHSNSSRIYFWQNGAGRVTTQFLVNDSVNVKLLSKTPAGILDISLATAHNIVLSARYYKPYPPGNVKINSVAYPSTASMPITVTWATRNRLTQTATTIIDQTYGNISAEVGTTYNFRFYDGATLIDSQTGLTGTSASFTPNTGDAYSSYVKLFLKCNGANNGTTFTDSSSVGNTITVSGTAKTITSDYRFNGSCGSFDGTTNCYITAQASANYNFGTGDFCIECWMKSSQASGTYIGLFGLNTNGAGHWRIGTRAASANDLHFSFNDGSWRNITTGFNVNDGVWHHICVVRISGIFYIYADGVLKTTDNTLTGNSVGSSSYTCIVGYNAADTTYYVGSIGEIKITKGVGRYSSEFLPEIGIGTIQYTSVLARMTGANNGTIFTDSSINNYTFSVLGNSKTSTTQYIFDGSAGYFDGSGDYLTLPNNTNYCDFGTNDFTIECWVRLDSLGSKGLVGCYNAWASSVAFLLCLSSGNIKFYAGNTVPINIIGAALSINTWYHVAVCRFNGVTTLYLDGTSTGTPHTGSVNISNASDLKIASDTDNEYFAGYMSNVRIVKGIAVYNKNFTRPAASFPAYTNATYTSPRIELESVRGGYTSNKHSISFTQV